LHPGEDVWLGFIGIQDLDNRFITSIADERKNNCCYADLEDFIKRTQIGLEQCKILIRVGALRFTGKNKKALLWDVYNYLGQQPPANPEPELFNFVKKDFVLPDLNQTLIEDAYDEIELLKFPLTLSMFDLIKTDYGGMYQL